MRHFPLWLTGLLVACLISLAPSTHAQGFVRADHQHIVDGKGDPLILRGLGLGGWMVQEGYMMGLSNLKAQHIISS
ncbi:glycoside hydrolase family 5 protein, partial [Agrobacterium rhizogenes]|nr:glycoside hydrolase family 5 protein [Rhizobium rhizogenes]